MANVPISNLTTTWNNVSTTFTGIKLNVTDTASAAASNLLDLQTGGARRFVVNKSGQVASSQGFTYNAGSAASLTDAYAYLGTPLDLGIGLSSSSSMGWFGASPISGSKDTILVRDGAAATLAQRNGVNAQTHRIYGTYTDGSNYRRLTKTMSTGGVAEIKPEGAGTGASGNVLHISGLPTANPGPGILWNDAGTVKVGT